MQEQWKDIPGYEGLYQVSNTGKVKSFRKSAKFKCPDEFILKNSIGNNGYVQVTLYKKAEKHKFLVHRLVAEAFIPNPNNLPQINHKDENTENNSADNLEWCSAKYNNTYGTARLRSSSTAGKKVNQYLPTGEYLATYACVSVASIITGVHKHAIKDCCFGRTRSGGGFVWTYADCFHIVIPPK